MEVPVGNQLFPIRNRGVIQLRLMHPLGYWVDPELRWSIRGRLGCDEQKQAAGEEVLEANRNQDAGLCPTRQCLEMNLSQCESV